MLLVRRLLPTPAENVVPLDEQLSIERDRGDGSPWVAINMVATVDGAFALGGVSGPIGGEGDHAMFLALRAAADVVVAAAGTVRAEGYGPARPAAEVRARRASAGRTEVPPICVVTRSLDLDLDSPLFTEAQVPTVVATTATADPRRRAAVAEVATVLEAGDDSVEPARLVAALGEMGHRVVLVEGGPALDAQLIAGGVVDEISLTVTPKVAGDAMRNVLGEPSMDVPAELDLTHVWNQDGELYLRYVWAATSSGGE
ncbi:MAG TPA: pyrimidine reductase family protein [Acidimicrobiales bacterium]